MATARAAASVAPRAVAGRAVAAPVVAASSAGAWAVAVAAALAVCSAADAQVGHRITGTWVPGERAVPNPLPLTAAARRAIDSAHDAEAADLGGPTEAPNATDAADPRPCVAPGMSALLDTHAPVEITQQGDKIFIRYAEWDATRTVYTNPRNGPPTQQPSAFGVSFGRWEGETLAIFTTYIAYPYFDRAGTPQSAAVSVLERYTPSADGSRLESKVTVTDAATFTAPVVIAGSMAAAGATDASPNVSAGAASSGAATALVARGCVG